MVSDVLINKAAIIERCLKRIDEEYCGYEAELETNFTRQDSILPNLQRACEASIDAAMHVVRSKKLGVPQESRDAFQLLCKADLIDADLTRRLQAMVGFRNIAVHNYKNLNMEIVRSIVEERLVDFQDFVKVLLTFEKVRGNR